MNKNEIIYYCKHKNSTIKSISSTLPETRSHFLFVPKSSNTALRSHRLQPILQVNEK